MSWRQFKRQIWQSQVKTWNNMVRLATHFWPDNSRHKQIWHYRKSIHSIFLDEATAIECESSALGIFMVYTPGTFLLPIRPCDSKWKLPSIWSSTLITLLRRCAQILAPFRFRLISIICTTNSLLSSATLFPFPFFTMAPANLVSWLSSSRESLPIAYQISSGLVH